MRRLTRVVRTGAASGSHEGPGQNRPLMRGDDLLALRVVEPGLRVGDVGEGRQELPVVGVDAVTERQLRALEEATDRLLGDVDDVVPEAPAVRPALRVACKHAE